MNGQTMRPTLLVCTDCWPMLAHLFFPVKICDFAVVTEIVRDWSPYHGDRKVELVLVRCVVRFRFKIDCLLKIFDRWDAKWIMPRYATN
jgi:hypothetical protein